AQLVLTAPDSGSVMALPRLQLAKKLQATSAVNMRVPLSALPELGVLSVTVAVQLLGLPTGTIAGMQLTSVLVSCLRAVTTKAPELGRAPCREREQAVVVWG